MAVASGGGGEGDPEAPQVAAAPGPGPGWVRPALWGTLLIAAVVLPLLRASRTPIVWSLWGEDGGHYLQDVYDDGVIDPLFRGLSGYAQVPSRLLFVPASVVPVRWAPPYVAVVAAIVAVVVAVLAVQVARRWIPSPTMRVVVAAWMVLTPVAGGEVNGNVVNLIWIYLAALPFALLSEEDGRRDLVARGGLVLLAATGTAASLVFLPLACGMALYRRTRASVVVAGLLIGGLALQAVVASATHDSSFLPPERSPVDLVRLTLARVFGSPLVGHGLAVDLWTDHRKAFMVVPVLVVVGGLVLVGWGADRRAQVVAALLVGHALVAFAFVVLGRGTNLFRLRGPLYPFDQPRFSYVPAVLLVGAFAVLASRRRPGAERSGRWARAILVAHAVVVLAISFTDIGYRNDGKDWRKQIAAAEAVCERPDASGTTEVVLSQDLLDFFTVTVTCADLR